jgi:hypothetical protein
LSLDWQHYEDQKRCAPKDDDARVSEALEARKDIQAVKHTYSGIVVDLANPTVDMIDLLDITTAIAQVNRWAGQTTFPISIAAHSVMLFEECYRNISQDAKDLAACLLHDGDETITGDYVGPAKALVKGSKELSDRLNRTIFERFGLPWPMPSWLKEIDQRVRIDERGQAMPMLQEKVDVGLVKHFSFEKSATNPDGWEGLGMVVPQWSVEEARMAWVSRFKAVCTA